MAVCEMIVFVEIYIRMRRAFERQKYSAPSLILSLLDRPNIGFGRSDILVSPNGFLFEAARRSPQYRRKCWPNHIGRGRWASLQIFDSQVRRLKIMPDWTGHRLEKHRTLRPSCFSMRFVPTSGEVDAISSRGNTEGQCEPG